VCCCWNECLQSYSSTHEAISNLLFYLQLYINLNNFYFNLSGPCIIDTRGTNCKVLPTYLQNRFRKMKGTPLLKWLFWGLLAKLHSQWTPVEWVTVFWSLENVQVSSSNNIVSVTELRISWVSMYQARRRRRWRKNKKKKKKEEEEEEEEKSWVQKKWEN
jgi:hypothetical protein